MAGREAGWLGQGLTSAWRCLLPSRHDISHESSTDKAAITCMVSGEFICSQHSWEIAVSIQLPRSETAHVTLPAKRNLEARSSWEPGSRAGVLLPIAVRGEQLAPEVGAWISGETATGAGGDHSHQAPGWSSQDLPDKILQQGL